MASAISWAVDDIDRIYPEWTDASVDLHALRVRAEESDDPAAAAAAERIESAARSAARTLDLPVLSDDQWERAWELCRADPFATACLENRGSTQVRISRIEEKDDGLLEVHLSWRAIVGGRAMNWGYAHAADLHLDHSPDGWEVASVPKRIRATVLYRPDPGPR